LTRQRGIFEKDCSEKDEKDLHSFLLRVLKLVTPYHARVWYADLCPGLLEEVGSNQLKQGYPFKTLSDVPDCHSNSKQANIHVYNPMMLFFLPKHSALHLVGYLYNGPQEEKREGSCVFILC